MKDYKHLAQKNQAPLTLIDIIGCACFFLLMFLPFSREAWDLLLNFMKG